MQVGYGAKWYLMPLPLYFLLCTFQTFRVEEDRFSCGENPDDACKNTSNLAVYLV